MKIGIGIPNQVRDVRGSVLPEWARRSEQFGFSTLGTIGRMVYPGVMDTVALAAAAGATTSIGLLSTVLTGPVWPAALLAKEIAGIDEVSGGRLTLGVGLGGRQEDHLVEGLGARDKGKRLDEDITIYRSVWRGALPQGGDLPLVTERAREVPLLFGGAVQASFDRVARSGEGYVAGTLPPAMVAPSLEGVRVAWKDAGRDGDPYLVALAYFAFADVATGGENLYHYYASMGPETADFLVSNINTGADEVRDSVRAFADLGVDELIFHPTTDDLDEIARLAEVVL
ncbi:LLM class flavin-dependent oxidoreductase [Spiractinospora alimapuensis]|uniref:LLM class flavin-dependent oxidoreductase n=1 Tax=Spiractinospora alimapuensis TaxID=2820884 RepID=UPI001F2F91FA|nr:LLM class flavin-dependent oxidoreductase [Spiractinospora alimapuensis]QVQ53405.1 LLM class flavin-dependent oxidoreductase [Spiractinospora alimapuensis]